MGGCDEASEIRVDKRNIHISDTTKRTFRKLPQGTFLFDFTIVVCYNFFVTFGCHKKYILYRGNMKIAGSSSYVIFDLENGYVVKAEGEILVDRRFVAYRNTMKNWEPPHENEKLSEEQIEEIIREVQKGMNETTVQIIFE